jgi:hypothetical protein
MSRKRFYWPLIAAATVFFTVALGVPAMADDVINQVDNSPDPALEKLSVSVGGQASTYFYVKGQGSDGESGCNIDSPPESFAITVSSSDTSKATVDASTTVLTFTDCGEANRQLVKINGIAAGTSTISVAVTTNTTGSGTFETAPATFTAVVDNAPSVTSTDPADGATNVGLDSNITVNFSEAVTVDSGAFTLECPVGTNKTFASSTTATSATLDPSSDLPAGTTCTVTVKKIKIHDADTLDGFDEMDADVVFSFTTKAAAPSDTTPPVISYTLTGTQGTNDWYTSNVFVDWTVSDPESSVVVDSGCVDETLTAETTGTTVSCSAHSAGGSASDSVTIKIDKTPPTAVLAVTAGTAGANGWYTSDVTVSTSGSDSISDSVTCTADQYQTTETTGAVFNGSCTNGAGLSTNAASLTVKLDKTGPSAALSITAGTLGSHGWYTSDVTVHTSGSDAVSSPVTCTADQFQTTETTGAEFNGFCTNNAGLTTNAAPLTVKLDKTGPTGVALTPSGTLGLNGWYISNVSVAASGTDTISDNVVCTVDGGASPESFNSETTGTTVNGECTNDAGLSTAASSISIKIDKMAPTLSPSVSPNPVVLNGPATATPNAVDNVSGVASSSCDPVVTNTVGPHSVMCYAADKAGNTSSASAAYSVKYNFSGFFEPVTNGVLNQAKAGQAIPVKWRITDANGVGVSDPNSFVAVTSDGRSCSGSGVVDPIELYAGSSGLQYLGDGYWQFNWKTPKAYAGHCRTMYLNLADQTSLSGGEVTGPSTRSAYFQFK